MKQMVFLKELEPGMILSETLKATGGKTLMEEGTVLTDFFINMLRSPDFSIQLVKPGMSTDDVTVTVEIPEPDTPPPPPAEMPEPIGEAIPEESNKELLLDPDYVKTYTEVLNELRTLLTKEAAETGINLDAIGLLIAEKQLDKLCDGAHAVTQIHNMDREEGDYLLQHSLHVAILAGLMGRWLHWKREQRGRLILAGLLLDVGKLKIPKEILEKPGKLTSDERLEVEHHPIYSHEILSKSGMGAEQEMLMAIMQHHERCDGSGYPAHLNKGMITPMGRILAILDVYDAMAANRSYARKISPFDIFNILNSDIMDGKLDAEYGVLFVKKMCAALLGNWVLLTTGEKAKIVYIDQSRTSSLPIVETEAGKFYDLASDSRVKINYLLTYREAVG